MIFRQKFRKHMKQKRIYELKSSSPGLDFGMPYLSNVSLQLGTYVCLSVLSGEISQRDIFPNLECLCAFNETCCDQNRQITPKPSFVISFTSMDKNHPFAEHFYQNEPFQKFPFKIL